MRVELCNLNDLDLSCYFFQKAIDFQKSKGGPSYKFVDRELFKRDIENGKQYKLINSEGEITFLFTIWESDPFIWTDKQEDSAFYLHRLLVNPLYRGTGLFQIVLDWIEAFALSKNKHYLRLDTWADSLGLTQLYERNGFQVIDYYDVPEKEGTSENAQGNRVVLLERKVGLT